MFPTSFIILAGFIGSVLTIYEFVNPRIGNSPKRSQILAFVFGTITVILLIGSILFSSFLSPIGGNGSGSNPIVAAKSPQAGTTFTPLSANPSTTTTAQPTATEQPAPTVQPTATQPLSIKPGDMLYTADFNNKASDWSFDDNWFISNGKLIGKPADSQAVLNVPIPTTDYTVKASIIITQVGTFGVVARYQSPTQGDTVALAWVTNTYIALSTCPGDDCAGPTSDRIPFLQTNRVYNLSITCKGVHITVTGEGHIISTDDTSNAPAAGNVALFNQGMGVEVLALQMIAA